MVEFKIANEETLHKMLAWRDSNKQLVIEYNPMFGEGMIEYGEHGLYKQGFKFIDDVTVRHEYYAGGMIKGFGFTYNRQNWTITDEKGSLTMSDYEKDNAIQDMITVHATIMALYQNEPHLFEEEVGTLILNLK